MLTVRGGHFCVLGFRVWGFVEVGASGCRYLTGFKVVCSGVKNKLN